MNLRPETRERGRRAIRPLLYIGAGALLLVSTMAVGAVLFVIWGVYDVSAVQQHTPPVYHTLDAALKRSIQRRARAITPPPLDDAAMIERGFQIYRKKCVECHGAPGVARQDVGKGLTPLPANLVHTARTWSAAEIYWTVRNGVKMSGMPAWRFKYPDEDLWSIVAFVKQLARFSPSGYRDFTERIPQVKLNVVEPKIEEKPDPQRGQLALRNYACTACHSIPGVVGPEAAVGPPLEGIAKRKYIAGVLPNTFENMVRWIRNPAAVDPLTAMPDLEVRHRDAIDITAYLETLD